MLSPEQRRRRWHRQRLVLIIVPLALGSVTIAHFASAPNPSDVDTAAVNQPTRTISSRPVYRYSVIKGGAYSRSELMTALDSDPVAASHYSVFRRTSVSTVESTFTSPVYVSYRIGDAIYWTTYRVFLKHRETLLTDGESYARARCGNRISIERQQPTAEPEPVEGALDLPEAGPPDPWMSSEPVAGAIPPVNRALVPVHPGASPIPANALPVPVTGPVAPITDPASPVTDPKLPAAEPPPVEIIPTPEPSSIVLLLIVLLLMGTVLRGKLKTR
jgi:hypothetical protein